MVLSTDTHAFLGQPTGKAKRNSPAAHNLAARVQLDWSTICTREPNQAPLSLTPSRAPASDIVALPTAFVC